MPAFRMVSQSVLLRGVNDDAATLEALMRAFVECRIKPYYLHHGDLAPGTAHLRTTLEQGQQLMRALRGRVSGPVPAGLCARYSRRPGKSPVGPNYLSQPNSPRKVNRMRNRAIVLSTIAATFIFIRRSHDPMTDDENAEPEPPDDQGNRDIENAVMLGFLWCWWRRESGCSAPWPTCERLRTVRHRVAATAKQSKSPTGRDRLNPDQGGARCEN